MSTERAPSPRGEASQASVSVVVPVYQAAQRVTEAAQSALAQQETGEVLLVEDGSSDGSLESCRRLVELDSRVRLLRHEGGANRGPGASRNLGMAHASHPFLAFLDADDVYLPNRFGVPLRILQSEPSLHGVYEATGLFFESPAAEARWRSASLGSRHLTTLRRSVHPEDLFEAMWPLGWDGHFHLNALTLRTKALELVGGFDEELLLHQDTAFCVRLSALVRLGPGRLDRAVATYRIHEENRVTAPRSPPQVHRDHIRMWRALWAWARGGGLEGDRLRHLYDRLAQDLLSAPGEDRGFLRRLTKRARRGARVLRLAPELLLDAELVVWVLSRTSGRFRH